MQQQQICSQKVIKTRAAWYTSDFNSLFIHQLKVPVTANIFQLFSTQLQQLH